MPASLLPKEDVGDREAYQESYNRRQNQIQKQPIGKEDTVKDQRQQVCSDHGCGYRPAYLEDEWEASEDLHHAVHATEPLKYATNLTAGCESTLRQDFI